jgi:hypothetical protein
MPGKNTIQPVAEDVSREEKNSYTRFSHKVEYHSREESDSDVRDGIRNQSQPQKRAHPGSEQLCPLAGKPQMKRPISAEIIEEIRCRLRRGFFHFVFRSFLSGFCHFL